jgi:hypothetical protein
VSPETDATDLYGENNEYGRYNRSRSACSMDEEGMKLFSKVSI